MRHSSMAGLLRAYRDVLADEARDGVTRVSWNRVVNGFSWTEALADRLDPRDIRKAVRIGARRIYNEAVAAQAEAAP